MRVNRGFLFWGLGFVTAGLVALAIQLGYLDRTAMAGAWRLWPVILVAVGLSLILSRTPLALLGTVVAALIVGASAGTAIAVGPGFAADCGELPSTPLQDHSGTFGRTASLEWQLDCVTLNVATAHVSSWRASVRSTGSKVPSVDGASDHLDLRSANQGNVPFLDQDRERWLIQLPIATTYQGEIHANGSTATLDLTGSRFSALTLQPNAADVVMAVGGANIEGLDVDLNAGSLSITASPDTSLSGSIQANAGSIKLCAPPGTALQITASGTAFGTNLDDSDLAKDGDTWESAGYAEAANKITLTVHGNAASFDLNPSGGCQ